MKPTLYVSITESNDDDMFFVTIASETEIDEGLSKWVGGGIGYNIKKEIYEERIEVPNLTQGWQYKNLERKYPGAKITFDDMCAIVDIGDRIGFSYVTTVNGKLAESLKKRPNIRLGSQAVERFRNEWIPF